MSEAEAPLVFSTPGGLCVRHRGRLLYSERDPSRLPKRTAAACDRGPRRLHLVFSPLLWYGIAQLVENMGPGSAVLCVEADPALARLSREAMPPALSASERVSFLESDSPEEVLLHAQELGRFRAASVLALSGGEALNSALYDRMGALVSSEIASAWRNRASLMVMGRLWARNVFANLAELPFMRLEPPPRFPGAVVVCGAGPSLEEALPFISARRKSVSVVACDTALGSLLAAGIEPDLLVCLEAQAHNLADFTPLGASAQRTIADLSSHPATFRAVRGPKHLSFVSFTDSPFLRRLAGVLDSLGIPYLAMPPLGSVGVHAAQLALRLARGPVLATGLDFSFELGKTHARGTPGILSEERRLTRTGRWNAQYEISFRPRNLEAPCPPLPDGRRLLSDPVLLSYAELLAGSLAAGSLAAGRESEERKTEAAALYDIRGRGPSIGAVSLTLEKAAALLDSPPLGATSLAAANGDAEGTGQAGAAAPCAPETGLGPNGGALSAALDGFLAAERGRLEELREAMKGRARMSPERFSARLGEADYLYWSFPDADRVKELPQDVLNRLLPEIEFWIWRIDSASGTLREELI
ncbi:MAG: DUF115 domain-containing protein [Treponema sp.]|nr:DUF115 domain-containing protein [Treponema sp.]